MKHRKRIVTGLGAACAACLLVLTLRVSAYPSDGDIHAAAADADAVPALLSGLGDFEMAHIVSLLVEEVYALGLPFEANYERTLKDFLDSAGLKLAHAHFLGKASPLGPFIAVAEIDV